MLTNCPECELQVSDKAMVCPHCGYPLKAGSVSPRSKNKRKRLPNGFGQISEMKGHNLRNKFRAMVTVGKTEDGKWISKSLKPQAYFATYNDAYEALVEYHKNPYDLDSDLTVSEVYEKWLESYSKELKNPSSIRGIKSAWSYCTQIHNMRIKDLRTRHLKGCIEDEKVPSASLRSRMKSVFNLLLDYAVEYELVDKNVARAFSLSENIIQERESSAKRHLPFTEVELDLLWSNLDKIPYVDALLIQCYSGWRPQELGLLLLENIKLDEGYMIGGMKTDAGTNRIVPIHSRIEGLIRRRFDEAMTLGSEYLLNATDGVTHISNIKLTYDKYRHRFERIRDELHLNPDHRAHDGRMTFVTLAKKYQMDEYAIKYIVGHSISDITERVYTKRDVGWLKSEVEKIR